VPSVLIWSPALMRMVSNPTILGDCALRQPGSRRTPGGLEGSEVAVSALSRPGGVSCCEKWGDRDGECDHRTTGNLQRYVCPRGAGGGASSRVWRDADHRARIWGEPADRDQAIAVLRRAVELGVDLIDTADSYGPYVSEELIRTALHPYPSQLVIAPRPGWCAPAQPLAPVGRPEYLRQECEMSLRRAPGADHPLPAPPHRSPGAARGAGRRAGHPPERGQDPLHRALQRQRGPDQGGSIGRRDRDRAERYNLVDRGPRMSSSTASASTSGSFPGSPWRRAP